MHSTLTEPLKKLKLQKELLPVTDVDEIIHAWYTSGRATPLLSSVIQTSVIFSRLVEHGVLSPATLAIAGQRIVRQFDREPWVLGHSFDLKRR